VWEIPPFDNADVFVGRLIRQGVLVRDPVVDAVRAGRVTDLSIRTLQYHFLRATGLKHKTIQQIERAHRAVSLLEQGVPIVEAAYALDYCDQAHLTNALKRFIGRTPAHIARKYTPA
jgi:methylphosphotriester-DNA--protein-cysteine methyltransferase